MRNRQTFCTNVKQVLKSRGLNYWWLHSVTEIPYQRLLREAKNAVQNPDLYDAVLIADALGVALPILMSEKVEASK